MNTIGMSWYTPESWERLRAVADDRATLGTFDAYQRKAERAIREFAAQGIKVEKVLLDIDDLVRWCRREGYAIDQRGRAAYGVALLVSVGDPEGRA